MIKRGKKIAESRDIISSLPDKVLGHILSHLPSKTAVRTCVLSTRWRNLYTCCRNLDLDDSSGNTRHSDRFMDTVDRCIMLRNGTNIDKFRLKCSSRVDASRFDSWICAAIRSNVRELDLCAHTVAPPLFLCNTLVVLKLATNSSPLDVPAFVHLPCLKILHLDSFMFRDKPSPIQRLLSGCPVLEEFWIVRGYHINGIHELSLSSSSLKRLTIDEYSSYKLVLDTPSLVYLELANCIGSGHAMKNVHSLSELHVHVSYSLEPTALPQLFEWISNVRSLYLSGLLDKFLLTTFDEPLVLKNLTCLELRDTGNLELSVVKKLLRWCPNLEEFSFRGSIGECEEYKDGCVDVPACVPSSLKMVKCSLSYYWEVSIQRDVALLEYFLNNATVLEKMQIRIWGGASFMTLRTGIEKWETTMETMRKLARSPGRSKTCNLKFIFTGFRDERMNIFVIEK